MSYDPPQHDDDPPYLVHLRPDDGGESMVHRHRRLILPAAAALAVIAVAAAGFIALGSDDEPALVSGNPTPTATAASAGRSPSPTPSPTTKSPSPSPSKTSAKPASAAPAKTTVTPTPSASPVSYQGNGAKGITFKKVVTGPLLMTTTWMKAGGTITIHAVAKDGKGDELLVDAAESYAGQVILNAAGKSISGLKITGAGGWSVKLSDLGNAADWNGKGTYSGTGDRVIGVDGSFAAAGSIRFVSTGTTSPVTVRAYAADGEDDLVVNDIDAFTGEYVVPKGTVHLVVASRGKWTMKKV